jgi:hypothetical protein
VYAVADDEVLIALVPRMRKALPFFEGDGKPRSATDA